MSYSFILSIFIIIYYKVLNAFAFYDYEVYEVYDYCEFLFFKY